MRQLELDADGEKRIRCFQFLTQKPMLYVLNVGEQDASKLHEIEQQYRSGPLKDRAHTDVMAMCGKIEAELAELPFEEAREYLASYGLKESGLVRMITASYRLLGLMSFLTAGGKQKSAVTAPIFTPAGKDSRALPPPPPPKIIPLQRSN